MQEGQCHNNSIPGSPNYSSAVMDSIDMKELPVLISYLYVSACAHLYVFFFLLLENL